METEEQQSTKENMTVNTLPPDTSTTRLRTRNQVKRSVVPISVARTSVPRTISSPLLHSQRKRPYPILPAASSTCRTLQSASVVAKLNDHVDELAKSLEPMEEECHLASPTKSTTTKKTTTSKKSLTQVTPVSTPPAQQLCNTPQTHDSPPTLAVSILAPSNSGATTDETNGGNVHSISDGGDGEWMKRSGSKRLRSVSLEKMSICDIETKKISLCVQSEDTPDSGPMEDGKGESLPINTPETSSGKEGEEITDAV